MESSLQVTVQYENLEEHYRVALYAKEFPC